MATFDAQTARTNLTAILADLKAKGMPDDDPRVIRTQEQIERLSSRAQQAKP